MSKTFMELFTELPMDLQRVVYQHLFAFCLDEIKNRIPCMECGMVNQLGEIKGTYFDCANQCTKVDGIEPDVCCLCADSYIFQSREDYEDEGIKLSFVHYANRKRIDRYIKKMWNY
jgi:hypothetical protein